MTYYMVFSIWVSYSQKQNPVDYIFVHYTYLILLNVLRELGITGIVFDTSVCWFSVSLGFTSQGIHCCCTLLKIGCKVTP